MLSQKDIRKLNRARDILKRVENECGTNRRPETDSWARPDGFSFGKIAEAADAAEGAIFNMLNLMNAHGVQTFSDEDMHNREAVDV